MKILIQTGYSVPYLEHKRQCLICGTCNVWTGLKFYKVMVMFVLQYSPETLLKKLFKKLNWSKWVLAIASYKCIDFWGSVNGSDVNTWNTKSENKRDQEVMMEIKNKGTDNNGTKRKGRGIAKYNNYNLVIHPNRKIKEWKWKCR